MEGDAEGGQKAKSTVHDSSDISPDAEAGQDVATPDDQMLGHRGAENISIPSASPMDISHPSPGEVPHAQHDRSSPGVELTDERHDEMDMNARYVSPFDKMVSFVLK